MKEKRYYILLFKDSGKPRMFHSKDDIVSVNPYTEEEIKRVEERNEFIALLPDDPRVESEWLNNCSNKALKKIGLFSEN